MNDEQFAEFMGVLRSIQAQLTSIGCGMVAISFIVFAIMIFIRT